MAAACYHAAMSEEEHRQGRFDHVFGTLLWGGTLGVFVGLAVSVAGVFMMISADEQWNTVLWPRYILVCVAFYIVPLGIVGMGIAAVVAAVMAVFRGKS